MSPSLPEFCFIIYGARHKLEKATDEIKAFLSAMMEVLTQNDLLARRREDTDVKCGHACVEAECVQSKRKPRQNVGKSSGQEVASNCASFINARVYCVMFAVCL